MVAPYALGARVDMHIHVHVVRVCCLGMCVSNFPNCSSCMCRGDRVRHLSCAWVISYVVLLLLVAPLCMWWVVCLDSCATYSMLALLCGPVAPCAQLFCGRLALALSYLLSLARLWLIFIPCTRFRCAPCIVSLGSEYQHLMCA